MGYAMGSHELYIDARNKGKKAYNAQKWKGASGHLPSLDGVLKDIDIVATVNLGVREIQLHKIIGTYYHTRRMLFSNGFFPLEDPQSEFAYKWMELCQAQLDVGIRDPIIVYEYLNYYYVMEGNKRVSVLKYFDAVKISAEVHRLIPKYDEEDETIRLYYGFLEFYQKTKIEDIWLSRLSRYQRLLRYLEDYKPPEETAESKYEYFMNWIYFPFRDLYLESGGQKLSASTGDAFVLYAKLYGIPKVFDQTHGKKVMPHLMKELIHYGAEDDVDFLEDEEELEHTTLLQSIATTFSLKKLKVGFVYAGTVKNYRWSYSHDLGRRQMEKQFPHQLVTGYIENVPEDKSIAYDQIKAFAEEGYDVIFTTGEGHRRATVSCAVEMPEVKFFNCSGNRPYVHMNNYFGRTYEPRFISGIIAGAMTKTDVIGYVATERNHEVISCINSFTLGAHMVNSDAKIKIFWTRGKEDWKESGEFHKKLIQENVDLLMDRNTLVPDEITKSYGVSSILCSLDPDRKMPLHYLSAPVWNWGVFYEKIIGSILSGGYQRILAQMDAKSKLMNFWWGMGSGVLDVYLSREHVPKQTAKLAETMRKLIQAGEFHPFEGPIHDEYGKLRIIDKELPTTDEVINMDWFVGGVELME